MSEIINDLKNLNNRMTTAISELERLDDNSDDFLDAVALSYRELVNICEHRREVIQRRKYAR